MRSNARLTGSDRTTIDAYEKFQNDCLRDMEEKQYVDNYGDPIPEAVHKTNAEELSKGFDEISRRFTNIHCILTISSSCMRQVLLYH